MKPYSALSSTDALQTFNVTTEGLSAEQTAKNTAEYGENKLTEGKRKSIPIVFLEQFKDLLVVILIAAAIISMLSGNVESTIVILAVIVLNALLGTVQHFKAEKSLDSLKALSSPNAKVIRGGEKSEIASAGVVPGDIVVLEAGDLVVADGRIISNYSLQVNESSLTGESEAVTKHSDVIDEENIPLGDRKNMVYSGSLVTYGRAVMLVTATGMNTEIGKIAALMNQTQQKKTPLQVSLDDFSKRLAMVVMGICVLVFGLNIYRQMPILDSLMFAVALAVAAIPEALSSIVTIVLAIGTQKMAKENAIIKDLKAVESLGAVSVICSDKTGTLTQNKMTAQQVYTAERLIDGDELDIRKRSDYMLITAAVLTNDSTSSDGKSIGDPTEVALVNLGHELGIEEGEYRSKYPRISELAFDSDRKLMSTLHNIDDRPIMLTKGALDMLLPLTKRILTENGVRAITDDDIIKIKKINEQLSLSGLRVLSFAYRELEKPIELTLRDEQNFTFIGLISMVDPPREESAQAVADAKRCGIKTIMITGDHKITASSIAKKIGIMEVGDTALDGIELDAMSDDELSEKLASISVYARVSPEHKIRIVNSWQKRGCIVSMTGDGVNDAPALKKADIGIAMGITGTEVSKDAASMILTDDNFATIIKAVTNGRNVYNNIKNSIKFLLSGNFSGILGVLYTTIVGLPVPFAPVHLLFINLLTDSLPAIAVGMEPAHDELLSQKPRDPKKSILTKDFITSIAVEGGIIGVFTMISYHIGLELTSPAAASTMAFATLTLARLFHGFNCRGRGSIFRLGLFTNPASIGAFLLGLFLLNSVLFIPFLQGLFSVAVLTTFEVCLIYLTAFMPTVIIQIYKVIREVREERL